MSPLFHALDGFANTFRSGDKAQKRALESLESAIDLHTKYVFARYEKAASQLCSEIEKLPASEQQTKVSLMASNLAAMLSKPVTVAQTYEH